MLKLTVLLLEDNSLDAELALDTLRDGGFDCLAERVETRQEFVAAAERGYFDLILADYSLPSFDGLSALTIARETCPEIPFIFLSGAIGEDLAIETLKRGATDYVLKQRMGRLVPSVRRALREAEDRRERRRAEGKLADLLAREQAARKEAEIANRLKDDFLATVSHELRTPLNAILGWAQLLKSDKLDRAQAARAVETIERSAHAQQKLIEDLLDVSRVVSGKLTLELSPVDLEPVIATSLDTLRPAAEAKNVRLEVGLDPLAGLLWGDPARLEQVFWNLLSNAIKFTPEGGRVAVSLRRIGEHIEVAVRDNGQGIDPDFLPYVFDPFRQADSSITRKHGGLGLGLAIVRHIVELHGGEIVAESPGAGQGATFTVRLPTMGRNVSVNDQPSRAADPLANPAGSLEGVRILAVDDVPDTREVLELLLTRSGAEVKVVASAAEALAEVEAWRPDALVSDIGMPGEDGYELIRKVRRLERGRGAIPAIALTAFAHAGDRERALAAGFNMHVAKPVNQEDLTAAITILLAESEQARCAL